MKALCSLHWVIFSKEINTDIYYNKKNVNFNENISNLQYFNQNKINESIIFGIYSHNLKQFIL